jgi:hypothetical protein
MKAPFVTSSNHEDEGAPFCSRGGEEAVSISDFGFRISDLQGRLLTSAAATVCRQYGLALLVAVVLATAGCGGNAKQREAAAFRRGQQQALDAVRTAQEPAVWFRGLVRHPRVAWHENLTLAQALVAADYMGALNPSRIDIIRQGQTYRVNPIRLLRGQEDPVLEPGDIIEIPR